MALSNFIVTVAGVGALILLTTTNVRHSAKNLKQNITYIREVLKQEFPSALKEMEKAKPKELPKK